MKLLVFDMGHVFVDFEWEQVRNAFAAKAGNIDETAAKKAFIELSGFGYESGEISTFDYVREINRILGTNISVAEFGDMWTLSFRENPDMAALFAVLGEQVPLYLLSNTNEVHYDFLQQKYAVDRHFQELILSYKVGCTKPDERIYHEVLNRSGFAADECLFVDDLQQNVDAASKLGMQVIRFQGVEDLKQKLVGHGFRV